MGDCKNMIQVALVPEIEYETQSPAKKLLDVHLVFGYIILKALLMYQEPFLLLVYSGISQGEF